MCLQFAPEFHVGDGIGMDLKLSNHVFNALKQHAYSEERRSARLHEKKEHSTAVCLGHSFTLKLNENYIVIFGIKYYLVDNAVIMPLLCRNLLRLLYVLVHK